MSEMETRKERDDRLDEHVGFVLREITNLRDEYRVACNLFRDDIHKLRNLIEREMYGEHGNNGLKTLVSKNTEFRENFTKYRIAVIGAFTTGLLSLLTMIIRTVFHL